MSRTFSSWSRLAGILGICSLAGGCTQTTTGFCDEPSEEIQWFYIKDSGPIGTLHKCILCDTSVEPQGVAAWILNNAGDAYLGRNDPSVHSGPATTQHIPCFYVYASAESAETCKVAVCGDDPPVNDPVHKEHGAGKIITSSWDFESMEGDPGATLQLHEFYTLPASLPAPGMERTAMDNPLARPHD